MPDPSKMTAAEILDSSNRTVPDHARNIQVYFDAVKDLPADQKFSVNNFLIGWLSGVCTREQWLQALRYAIGAAIEAKGGPERA
jgi:hypothetical protein